MSNTDRMRIWVGDLDDHIDVDQINRGDEREVDGAELRDDVDTIGDIPLLDGRRTSASAMSAKGIRPGEWRWALHEAEKALSTSGAVSDPEDALLNGLIAIGRPYAIGRHARWERLTLAAARTAVLPFGHLALVDQQLSALDPARAQDARRAVRAAIRKAEAARGLIAYERTGLVRNGILESMDVGRAGATGRERMRVILSLTRLRFSATELRLRHFDQLRELEALYAAARRRAIAAAPAAPEGSRPIRNWSLRHINPLISLMPIAVRAALDRGFRHLPPRRPMTVAPPGSMPHPRFERVQAVNELALARCATILIARASRPR